MTPRAKGRSVRRSSLHPLILILTIRVLRYLRLGVLTKPDRIPLGEESRWLRFIRNEYEPLEHGWFSVKQPDSNTLKKGVTWDEARTRERDFFSSAAPWSELPGEVRGQLGTANLTDRLSAVLSDTISTRYVNLLVAEDMVMGDRSST